MFITGKLEGKFSNDETCILKPEQNQKREHDVLIPKSLVKISNPSVVFSVLTPTDNAIHLKKSICIGSLQGANYIIKNDLGVENKEIYVKSDLPSLCDH